MVDLNKLSGPALSAAMRGGTSLWGQHGSSAEDVRYAQLIVPKSRKKCHCGCEGKKTHAGMANGMCLITACQLAIQRWVKTGTTRVMRAPVSVPAPADATNGTAETAGGADCFAGQNSQEDGAANDGS